MTFCFCFCFKNIWAAQLYAPTIHTLGCDCHESSREKEPESVREMSDALQDTDTACLTTQREAEIDEGAPSSCVCHVPDAVKILTVPLVSRILHCEKLAIRTAFSTRYVFERRIHTFEINLCHRLLVIVGRLGHEPSVPFLVSGGEKLTWFLNAFFWAAVQYTTSPHRLQVLYILHTSAASHGGLPFQASKCVHVLRRVRPCSVLEQVNWAWYIHNSKYESSECPTWRLASCGIFRGCSPRKHRKGVLQQVSEGSDISSSRDHSSSFSHA